MVFHVCDRGWLHVHNRLLKASFRQVHKQGIMENVRAPSVPEGRIPSRKPFIGIILQPSAMHEHCKSGILRKAIIAPRLSYVQHHAVRDGKGGRRANLRCGACKFSRIHVLRLCKGIFPKSLPWHFWLLGNAITERQGQSCGQ